MPHQIVHLFVNYILLRYRFAESCCHFSYKVSYIKKYCHEYFFLIFAIYQGLKLNLILLQAAVYDDWCRYHFWPHQRGCDIFLFTLVSFFWSSAFNSRSLFCRIKNNYKEKVFCVIILERYCQIWRNGNSSQRTFKWILTNINMIWLLYIYMIHNVILFIFRLRNT